MDRVGLIIFIGWIVAFLLRVIRKANQRASTGTYTRSQGRWGPNPSQRYRSPHDVLEVSPGASREEVSAAYRRLVQQYHPDKVSALGPELRELAEQRMKEINSAYESLKRQNSS